MTLEPIPIAVGEPPIAMPIGPHEASFEVRLPIFSGPLDLLLHLIESRQLEILTVPLAELADAYVAYLAANPVDARELSEFVAIAAKLILLKSRRMLPSEPLPPSIEPGEETDEDELRSRLIEYRSLRDAARALGERDLAAPLVRRQPRVSDLPEVPAPRLDVALLATAMALLATIPEPVEPTPEIVAREITIGMQITALRAAMAATGRVVLQQLLATCRSRTEATVTVLATLELVRRRLVRVEQDELFGPILIELIG